MYKAYQIVVDNGFDLNKLYKINGGKYEVDRTTNSLF